VGLILLPAWDAFSLPEGETYADGTATFDRSIPNVLKVTTHTDNAVINYSSFGIADNEYVYFYMPSNTSNALNRVLGNDISNINGSLYADGRIYIVNPNGIVFGANANVDVAGLVASSLDITDEDFLAGNYDFEKLSDDVAKIVNQGNIIASAPGGFVALLSDSIANEGLIQAQQGSILLAGGEKMTLSFDNNGLIQVVITEKIQTKLDEIDDAILNTGTLNADSGLILIKADTVENLFRNAVNNKGAIKASTMVEGKDGSVEIIAEGEGGHIVSTGIIKTDILKEKGASCILNGTTEVGTAYLENLDGAADVGGEISGTYQDNGDIRFTSNITLTGTTTFQADLDGDQIGTINEQTYTLAGGGYDLTLYTGENVTLSQDITDVGTLELYSSTSTDKTYTSTGTNFSCDTLKTNYHSIFTRNETDGGYQLIFSVSDAVGGLQYMGQNLSGDYKLANNIDASETTSWTSGFEAVGDSSTKFTGSLDGNDKTISNLYIYNNGSRIGIGLFGYTTSASIQDLGLVDVNVDAAQRVGALVGQGSTTITNCYSTGTVDGSYYVGGLVGYHSGSMTDSYSEVNVSGSRQVGGLVGSAYYGFLTQCYATGSVTGNANYGHGLGGLVGIFSRSFINECYATGNVTSTKTSVGKAGGLVGSMDLTHTTYKYIQNSYATGNVSVTDNYIGGLVGYTSDDFEITNCHATGNVSSVNWWDDYMGGLIGGVYSLYDTLTITNSFHAGGTIDGDNYIGGLIGDGPSSDSAYSDFTNNWWNNDETLGVGDAAETPEITGKYEKAAAASEFYSSSDEVYTGAATWDYDSIWTIDEGNAYPTLQYQYHIWNASSSGNTSTASNWNKGILPGSTDWVFFNDTSGQNATIDSTLNVGKFYVSSGYGGTITFDVSSGNTIQTDGKDINLSGCSAIVIAEGETAILTTGAAAAGNIAIGGTINGTAGGSAENLTLISGTGTTTMSDAVGGTTSLGALTLQADNASATGAVTFNGSVSCDSLITYGRAYSVAFNGASNTITQDTTFLNTGTLTLGNGNTDSITFTGGLDTQACSASNIAGTVQTTNTQMDLGAVSLAADAVISTGAGAGSLNFRNKINGTQTLTLNSGTGDMLFVNEIGDTGKPTNLTIQNTKDIDFQNNVSITGNFEQTAGTGTTSFTDDKIIDVDGSFTIGSTASIDANSSTIKVGANWTNNGTFTQASSTAVLDGASECILTGDTTFNNLTCETAGKTLTFEADSTQTIEGTLTLKGETGDLLTLQSGTSGTQWSIDPQGDTDIEYVEVTDSSNENTTYIDPAASTDGGNNLYWFTPAASDTTTTVSIESLKIKIFSETNIYHARYQEQQRKSPSEKIKQNVIIPDQNLVHRHVSPHIDMKDLIIKSVYDFSISPYIDMGP